MRSRLRAPQDASRPTVLRCRGSRLFGLITDYPNTTDAQELALLRNVAPSVVSAPAGAAVVEYGAGNEVEAAILLERYATRRLSAHRRRRGSVDGKQVPPRAGSFPARDPPDRRRLPRAVPLAPRSWTGCPGCSFFPGSTISQSRAAVASAFSAARARNARNGAMLLVGVDLRKDPSMVFAYDDANGITAAFNRNVPATPRPGSRRRTSIRPAWPPRPVERSREPDRDAPGRATRRRPSCRGSVDRVRRKRNDPHRNS